MKARYKWRQRRKRKASIGNEVKRVIDEVVTIKGVPSVIAGGLQNGKRWSYATGTASYEVPHAVESNFSFRIGSISKTFTASVVLQLADEKKLNLDDSIEKWLPGVIKGEGYDGNKITIRQLLNHTSGLLAIQIWISEILLCLKIHTVTIPSMSLSTLDFQSHLYLHQGRAGIIPI